MRAAGRVAADEPITVSLYLKPAGGTRVLADRASMLSARVTEHGDDMTAVSDFAANHGLAIAGSDPARRLVRLTGPASAMEQAFGTELSHYEGGGQTCRRAAARCRFRP